MLHPPECDANHKHGDKTMKEVLFVRLKYLPSEQFRSINPFEFCNKLKKVFYEINNILAETKLCLKARYIRYCPIEDPFLLEMALKLGQHMEEEERAAFGKRIEKSFELVHYSVSTDDVNHGVTYEFKDKE